MLVANIRKSKNLSTAWFCSSTEAHKFRVKLMLSGNRSFNLFSRRAYLSLYGKYDKGRIQG